MSCTEDSAYKKMWEKLKDMIYFRATRWDERMKEHKSVNDYIMTTFSEGHRNEAQFIYKLMEQLEDDHLSS